jgi:pimeloyl-ACP methyl ester carboxylesterase
VHGLAGAAVNWSAIAPLLTQRYRLLAPDLSGHGLTWSARRGSGVPANRILLDGFLASVATGPVILMGNSMGGMISLLEAAAAPKAVAGLILIDPALPLALARPDPLLAGLLAAAAIPGLGALLSRLDRRRARRPADTAAAALAADTVAAALALCCADPSRVAPEEVARHVYVARERAQIAGADRDFLLATRSVAATVFRQAGRHYRHTISSVSCPVLLVHGDRDRLVPVAAARAATHNNPKWSVPVLPGLGHVPMLETPGQTAELITSWLESAVRAAAQAASG